MDTRAIALLSYRNLDDDTYGQLSDLGDEKGYERLWEAEDECDYALLIDDIPDGTTAPEGWVRDMLKNGGVGKEPDGIRLVFVTDENVEDWAPLLLPGLDADVVAAVVWNESDSIGDPDYIRRTIEESYIGYFGSRGEVAAMLAEDDPKLQALDWKIRYSLDLEEYYDDILRFEMWHDDDGHWFWNR